jgi:hypothetical protein
MEPRTFRTARGRPVRTKTPRRSAVKLPIKEDSEKANQKQKKKNGFGPISHGSGGSPY